MEFKTNTQRDVYQKASEWMKEVFGETVGFANNIPVMRVRAGSAHVYVEVVPWDDGEAVIRAFSWVVQGAELRPDLFEYLVRMNSRVRFGAFSVNDEGDIIFSHAIVGTTCDKDELKASVFAVMSTADDADDEIVSRWGGQRALDVDRLG